MTPDEADAKLEAAIIQHVPTDEGRLAVRVAVYNLEWAVVAAAITTRDEETAQ